MLRAVRVLMLPPGFWLSTLAKMVRPSPAVTLGSATKGVLPIDSKIVFAIVIIFLQAACCPCLLLRCHPLKSCLRAKIGD